MVRGRSRDENMSLEVIRRYNAGESVRGMATAGKVARRTVHVIIKQYKKFETHEQFKNTRK